MTRVWHWVLVLVVGVGWSFGKFMSSDNVTWHFYLGYVIFALIVFRVFWDLFGPASLRFKTLKPAPSSAIKYIRSLTQRKPSGDAGHSPLGSLWIIAILILLTAQGISGLFIEAEDFFENGPLFDYVSEETSDLFYNWHYYLSNIILGMVILHVSVILFYLLWKKENLVKPMITGWKQIRDDRK